MATRNIHVAELIKAHELVVKSLPDSDVKAFLHKCHTALSQPGEDTSAGIENYPPVCRHLSASLKIASVASNEMKALAKAFYPISKMLPWKPRTDYCDQNRDFYEGHANAVIVGEGGLEAHDSVRMGVSLIAPRIEYPNHRHPPEEGYLVLSEGEWRQEAAPWFKRKSGETIHNSPNIWHAMRAGEHPLLAIWMLWMKTGTD